MGVIGVSDSSDSEFEDYHRTAGFRGLKSKRLLLVNCHRHLVEIQVPEPISLKVYPCIMVMFGHCKEGFLR